MRILAALWGVLDILTGAAVVLLLACIRGLIVGLLLAILWPPLGVFGGIIAFFTGFKGYDNYRDVYDRG